MGIWLSTLNESLLSTTNNIWENSSSACIATCNAPQNNPTIILNGTTVAGNVEIVATCSASAACAMQSQLDSQVQNIMQSMVKQKTISTELIPISFMFATQNSTNIISQTITNNITQSMQSICQGTSNTMLNNPTIIGTNATVGGNLTITSGGSANANCTINNLARMSLFNAQTSTSSQINKRSNILGIVMVAIVMMMVIGAIVVLLIMGPEGVASVVGASKGGGETQDGELGSLLEEGEEGAEGGEGGGKGKLAEEAMEFA
jgi:hypothetical protein